MSHSKLSQYSFLNPCVGKADKIHALLSGNLSRKAESALNSHLETCAACRDYLDFMGRLNDDFRTSFEKQPGTIPPGLPKQIRDEMGLALQESLANWLMESGKTLFLINNGKADCVNYRTEPLLISECRFQMGKIIQALSRPDEIAVSSVEPGFLKECRELCIGLDPISTSRSISSLIKECLDRSLEIKPDDAGVMNILGDHFFYEGDTDSAIRVFSNILDLNPTCYSKYAANLNLASAWYVKNNGEEAQFHLTEAQKNRDDALVNFNLSLVYIYLNGDIARGCKYIQKMNGWIQVEKEFVDISHTISIISILIQEYFESLSEKMKDFDEIVRIIRRYNNPVGICS